MRHVAYKTWAQGRLARENRPARPLQRHFREKTRPASVKTPILSHCERAGELFRAHAHIRPRRANFFAHEAQQHSDVETNNTTARPQTATIETTITSATEKRTQNAHFAPAKVIAVSIPHRYQRAKAMAVSDNRPTWPTGPGSDAHGQQRHHRLSNFARNLSCSFFETPQKRCNSNDANSMFEQVAGELRAKLMGEAEAGPGRGAGGRRQGQGGPRDRPLRAAGSGL